jgi:anti-sigma factor RsiW
MEDILARYLDGELTEKEADALLRTAREDRSLEKELRNYEAILAAAEQLPPRSPRDGFAGRVMRAIDRPRATRSHRHWYLAAAALILGLFLGYAATLLDAPTTEAAYPAIHPVQLASGPANAVRLTYTGSRPDLESVSVAGSFNGWDPTAAPMVREHGAWTILLVLPPGSHEYMFVEDGVDWVTDPRAPGTRRDGFGGANGLLEIRS